MNDELSTDKIIAWLFGFNLIAKKFLKIEICMNANSSKELINKLWYNRAGRILHCNKNDWHDRDTVVGILRLNFPSDLQKQTDIRRH